MKSLALSFVMSLTALVGCASLERGDDQPAPPPDYPDAMPVEPDAPLPPDGGTCEPPPPECSCDQDCGYHESCHQGKCYERCDCDNDCDHGESCRWGFCKSEH